MINRRLLQAMLAAAVFAGSVNIVSAAANPAAIEDLLGTDRPAAVAAPRPSRCKVISKRILKLIVNACAGILVINASEKFGDLVGSAVELSQDAVCAWTPTGLIPSVDTYCQEREDYARAMRLHRAIYASFWGDEKDAANVLHFLQTADREEACAFAGEAHQLATTLDWKSADGHTRIPHHILTQAYDKCIGISK